METSRLCEIVSGQGIQVQATGWKRRDTVRVVRDSGGLLAHITMLGVLGLAPLSAIADDPCAEPIKQVKALVLALNKAAPPQSKPGRFEVKRLSAPYEAGIFQVSYVIDHKPVFSQRLEQRDKISDHFAAEVSRKAPSVLEIGYAFGAGGAIVCEYAITRTNQEFRAVRTRAVRTK